MADEIVIEWQANQTSLMQALLQQQGSMQKSVDKLNDMAKAADGAGKAVKKTADESGQTFQIAGAELAKFAVGIAGVGSATAGVLAIANHLKAEWQDLRNRQKQAANTQLSLATRQADMFSNLGDDPVVKAGDDVIKRVKQISKNTGVSEDVLTSVSSAAFSSRANLPATAALDAVEAAAKLAPHLDEAGLTELTSASMGLQKRGLSSKESLGFFQAVGATSPIRNMTDTARNVAPAISRVAGYGGTLEESGAIVSALASGMQDVTGEKSANAAGRLTSQLAERLPFISSPRARIEAIQKDAELRQRILGPEGGMFRIKGEDGKETMRHFPQIELREAGEVPALELLRGTRGGTGTTEAFEAALKSIPAPGKASSDYYEKEILKRQGLRSLKGAGMARQAEAGAARFRAGDYIGGETDISAEGLEKILMGVGTGRMDRAAAGSGMRSAIASGQDPASAFADRLRLRASGLQMEVQKYPGNFVTDWLFGNSQKLENEKKSENAQELLELAKAIEAFKNAPPVNVTVKVEGPPGLVAKPGAGAMDRRDK